MKTTVVGAGGLGLLITAILKHNKADVKLFTRRREAAQKISEEGIKVLSRSGELHVFPECIWKADDITDSELLIFTVKAYDTLNVAHIISPCINKGCQVLTIQNGFNNLEELTSIFGEDRVVGGVTTQAATLMDTNTVFHAHAGLTIVGKTSNDPAVDKIANHLSSYGVETKVSEDIIKEIYVKGIVNCVINPLTALTGVRNGELLKLPWFNEIAREIVCECVEVAKQLGIVLDANSILARVEDVIVKTGLNKSSMLQDVENRRKTEIEQLNAWISGKAMELGVRTPLNKLLASMVKMLEMRLISNQ
ncbi:MAG TPA: 2-dehydropantoate 2-reductase [Candidatus Caldiarchaeum subterraneum]|uniref:2-dehydropantoate 2-reductase n=1 Tax=Caldiarchaeum subterraneum TaxID=311458 RepID=A0A833E9T6_CALS0|nr:2-dehydropantoate 2-reductase [Candidatus Caldarchaeum subterraneum]